MIINDIQYNTSVITNKNTVNYQKKTIDKVGVSFAIGIPTLGVVMPKFETVIRE